MALVVECVESYGILTGQKIDNLGYNKSSHTRSKFGWIGFLNTRGMTIHTPAESAVRPDIAVPPPRTQPYSGRPSRANLLLAKSSSSLDAACLRFLLLT